MHQADQCKLQLIKTQYIREIQYSHTQHALSPWNLHSNAYAESYEVDMTSAIPCCPSSATTLWSLRPVRIHEICTGYGNVTQSYVLPIHHGDTETWDMDR